MNDTTTELTPALTRAHVDALRDLVGAAIDERQSYDGMVAEEDARDAIKHAAARQALAILSALLPPEGA